MEPLTLEEEVEMTFRFVLQVIRQDPKQDPLKHQMDVMNARTQLQRIRSLLDVAGVPSDLLMDAHRAAEAAWRRPWQMGVSSGE